MKKLRSGFTLVELLIVVALIAILAVIVLMRINPLETQKRTRDTQRLRDISVIQGAVEAYVADNTIAAADVIDVYSSTADVTNECSDEGWLSIDVCDYVNNLPMDPINDDSVYVLHTPDADGNNTAAGTLRYQVHVLEGGTYAICTRLESERNIDRLSDDGVEDDFYSVYNNVDAVAECD